MMKQILFVLHEGKIRYGVLGQGRLSFRTLGGDHWREFSPSYWEEWKKANQAEDSDVIDAILLSDQPNGFDNLPNWICPAGRDDSLKTDWKFDDLQTLDNRQMLDHKPEFSGRGLSVIQGEIERKLSDLDNPLTFFLTSSLGFTLPKEEEVRVEPPKVVKSTVVVDCYVDEKSRQIKEGAVVQGKVKAFSPFRGCYIDSPAASDLILIKPEEVEKCKEYAETLKGVGNEVLMSVASLSEGDNKIVMSVTFGR